MNDSPHESTDATDEQTHVHEHHHHDVSRPGVAVLTISSSRTEADDPAGDTIETILEAADHRVLARAVVTDDHDAIQSRVTEYTDQPEVDAIVTTGGTGITPDDVTVEAVSPLFSKDLPGFGELFRQLSYEEIGTRSIGTRAIAGVVGNVPVFCLPGSENAVRLGSKEIIRHELSHLVGLAQRDTTE